MAKAIIDAGICGEETIVEASKLEENGYDISRKIESSCPFVQNLAEELTEVNAFNQISFRRGMPEILEKGSEHCTHAACPVPVGIIKTVEVSAGLALPKDASIKLEG